MFKIGDLVRVKPGCEKSTASSFFDLSLNEVYVVTRSDRRLIGLSHATITFNSDRFELANLTPLERFLYGRYA